jgi:hypothetical protein
MVQQPLWGYNARASGKSEEESTMAIQTADMRTVLDRLEKLEWQNRRMKLWLSALVVVALVAAVIACVGRRHAEVRAERFVLVDSNGYTRAELGMNPGYGPEFTMGMLSPPIELNAKEAEALKTLIKSDPRVGPPASLKLSVFGLPSLVLTDFHGKERLELSAIGNLLLADRTSKWGTYLTSTGLQITDEDGYGVSLGDPARAGLRNSQTQEELAGGPSIAKVTIFGGQRVLWHAP